VVDVPTSALIAGSRIVTAEVFALTTRVETQVAASTPAPTFVVAGVGADGGASSVLTPAIVGVDRPGGLIRQG
jgi:hypothetical protein